MKILIAILMGGLSGFLLYLMGGILFLPGPGPAIVLILLFGGWAGSTYGLLRNAQAVSDVLARGFLLGAVEWLLMIGVGLVRRPVAGSSGILVASMIGAVSVVMAVVCLTGFAAVQIWQRRMTSSAEPRQPEQASSSM